MWWIFFKGHHMQLKDQIEKCQNLINSTDDFDIPYLQETIDFAISFLNKYYDIMKDNRHAVYPTILGGTAGQIDFIWHEKNLVVIANINEKNIFSFTGNINGDITTHRLDSHNIEIFFNVILKYVDKKLLHNMLDALYACDDVFAGGECTEFTDQGITVFIVRGKTQEKMRNE
jgi:hypothetical protein